MRQCARCSKLWYYIPPCSQITCDRMKRTIVCVLMATFALGCVVTAVSPFVFVYETEDVRSLRITYEKGLPFPYIIETVQVEINPIFESIPPSPPRVIRQEVLTIPLLSSILSNTVVVAGIIGLLLIRAKQSSMRTDRARN